MSSSCHPAVLPDPAAASDRAMKSANVSAQGGLVDVGDEPTEGLGHVRAGQAVSCADSRARKSEKTAPVTHGQPELLDVLRAHAVEEVEALGVEGGHAGDEAGGLTSLGHERGAGQGVGATARPSHRHESVVAEEVEDLAGIGGDIGDAPSGLTRGTRVPRARPVEKAGTPGRAP